MKSVTTATATAILLASATPAGAEDRLPAGVHEHDGFFLQLQYLLGYQDLFDDGLSVGGPGSGFRIAIGGTPVRNFVVFGELYGQAAPAPRVEIHGRPVAADEAFLTLAGIGPGVGYYFGDTGVFLHGALSFVSAQLDGPTGSSRASGTGGRLGLGKEWWVSDQWGLGLAGNCAYTVVSDELSDDFNALALSLAFSATYH